MKRLIFFFLYYLVFILQPKTSKENGNSIIFFTIKIKVKKIKPVSSDDFMIIKNDGTFNYELKKANIYASGRWTFDAKKSTITFLY